MRAILRKLPLPIKHRIKRFIYRFFPPKHLTSFAQSVDPDNRDRGSVRDGCDEDKGDSFICPWSKINYERFLPTDRLPWQQSVGRCSRLLELCAEHAAWTEQIDEAEEMIPYTIVGIE